MDIDVPDGVSYMALLEALAIKHFCADIEDEEAFADLVVDLAGLHTETCFNARVDPGTLPNWFMIS